MNHEELKRRYNNGTIAIGIDPSGARRFYTNEDNSSVNGLVIKTLMILEFISFLSVLIGSIFFLKYYSIAFIPTFLIIYLPYKGRSSMANQNLLGVMALVFLSYLGAYYAFSNHTSITYLLLLFPLPFLFVRIMYKLSVIFFRKLVIENKNIFEFFIDKIVFIKE